MVNRPSVHQRLGGAEQVFYLQQVAVAQNRLQRGDARIGAQHEDAIEARFVGELAGIDLEGSATRGGAQVAAIGRVADQRLVAALELLVERLDNSAPVGGILGRLGLVAADDVAASLDGDLLDEEL